MIFATNTYLVNTIRPIFNRKVNLATVMEVMAQQYYCNPKKGTFIFNPMN